VKKITDIHAKPGHRRRLWSVVVDIRVIVVDVRVIVVDIRVFVVHVLIHDCNQFDVFTNVQAVQHKSQKMVNEINWKIEIIFGCLYNLIQRSIKLTYSKKKIFNEEKLLSFIVLCCSRQTFNGSQLVWVQS